MTQSAKAYANAGVNLDAADAAKQAMRAAIRTTHGPQVLGAMGGFGGLFALDTSGLREPVLVSSIDGVGTKLKIAFALNRHRSVGADLVNHCVNDILVCGARPLFFLDYLALGTM
ncbi:MAG TPA: AIR synthase related protein, partial [Ktedonobacterales bacterium]|nr:AIR synthase related protein [Ktedonobacterales bacterium]